MNPAWTLISAFAGALLVLLLPARAGGQARVVALVAAIIGAIAAGGACLYKLKHPDAAAWDFNTEWIPQLGIRFHLAANGLSLTLLLLTGLVAIAGILFSWNVEHRQRAFFAFFMTIIGGVYGVFLSRDAFLMFV
ncbi:MAG: dehydrogenase subunit, partial [Verrucomicrobiota bacterium]